MKSLSLHAPVLRPESTLRIVWDAVIGICTLYSLIYVPVRSSLLHGISLASDSIALFDVLVQFNIAMELDGVVIEDRRIISREYLKNSFLIDLLSATPWELLAQLSNSFQYIHCVAVIVRLSRLQRMHGIQTQIEKLQYRIENRLIWVLIYVFRMFSILITLAHWFACLWFFLGTTTEGSIEPNWFSTAPSFERTDFVSCYVSSLYFCITTIVTVGYGDEHAMNTREKLFAMSMMIVAWMVLLVISGVLTSTIVRYDEQGAKFSELMNRSMKYMIRNHIDSQLQGLVRTFLLQQIDHEATEEVHTELMTHLDASSRMKSEVYVGLWGKHLKKYGWFGRFPSHLLGNVCSACEMMRFSPNDLVVRPGNIGDGMYFVIKGKAVESAVGSKSLSTVSGGLGVLEPKGGREIGPNEFFGEKSLFIPTKWQTEVRCETYCEILYLPKEKLEYWMSENDDYMQLLRNQRAIAGLLYGELGVFEEALAQGINPSYCDPDGHYLLHTAARMELVDAAESLVKKGALTGVVDQKTGKYPLQLAALSGNPLLVDIIAEYQDMSEFLTADPPAVADIAAASDTIQVLVLFAAASSGYYRVVGYLLDKCKTHVGVNDAFALPPSCDAALVSRLGLRYVGFTLSDIAAKFGHTDVIDALCDHQADFNAAVSDRPRLPLHYAVEAGQKDAVSHLVKHGALIVLKDQDGLTPLDLASKLEMEERNEARLKTRRAITLMLRGLNLHDLSKDGKLAELRSAISDKCDPNIIHPKTGRTPLQYAADSNQTAVIRELVSSGATIDFTGVSQVTALYSALMKGHVDATTALLVGGADPNKALENGSTPLTAAIKKGSQPLVDLLLSFGARPVLDDVKAAFEKKDKALVVKMRDAYLAAAVVAHNTGRRSSQDGGRRVSRELPVMGARASGSTMLPRVSLASGSGGGVGIGVPVAVGPTVLPGGIWALNDGESMFHQFCRKGDVAIVTLALEFGADVFKPTLSGQSPLEIAAGAGKDKVAELLVKTCKTVAATAAEWEEYVKAGLVAACKVVKGTLPVVKLLLALGANVGLPEATRESAKSGHTEALKFVISQGVNVMEVIDKTTFGDIVVLGNVSVVEVLIGAVTSSNTAVPREAMIVTWGVVEAAAKSPSEVGKDDMRKLLCEKIEIDPNQLELALPGTASGVDTYSANPGAANRVDRDVVQSSNGERKQSILRRMISSISARKPSASGDSTGVTRSALLLSQVSSKVSAVFSKSRSINIPPGDIV